MFDKDRQVIEEKLVAFLTKQKVPIPDEIKWTGIPFTGEWGISTPFFPIAAGEARSGKKINVPKRAAELAEKAAKHLGLPPGFSRVEAVKGYLNLYFSTNEYTKRVVDTVIEESQNYGSGTKKGERTLIEFSQPNTHKAFHVGHLRSMILGAALSNIHEFAGYDVIRANYPGDAGLHVIRWLWNYEKYHAGEKRPETAITQWMGQLYTEAVQRLEENPEFEKEVRATFARWEQKDPALMDLYYKTRQWSFDGFNEIYDRMGIYFDRYYYQIDQDEKGKQLIEDLIERGIAEDERPDGPVIVRVDQKLGLKEEKFRVAVVLRSDNSALYSTWDLALALQKYSDYNLDHSLYVVDVRQSLHFQQVFKILEIAGHDQEAKVCKHIPYEIVTLPGNVVMASREGTIVLLEALLSEAVQRAGKVAAERNPSLTSEQRSKVAEAVGLAAIKFPMLARENTRVVTFDWQTALDFDGQAAPYIQYAHVRCASILRKLEGEALPESIIPQHTLTPTEIELIDIISRFPETVQSAATENKTLSITNLAYDLARAFNNFYNQCPVLQAEPEIRAVRLRMVAAAKQTISNCLALLTIRAPEYM
jgi:arginyl-tRNA synthetase